MADQNLISPSTTDPTGSSWWQYIMGAKPVSGSAFNGSNGSNNNNPLGSFGSTINTQPNGSASGAFNPDASLPSSPAAQQAANTAGSNTTIGNTQATSNAQASQQALDPFTPLKSVPTPTNNSTAPSNGTQVQQPSSGLPSGTFQQAVSSLAKNAFSGITNTINSFGTSLGFANSSSAAALNAGLSSADAAALGSNATAVNAAGDSIMANVGTGGLDAFGGGLTFTGALGAAGLGYFGGSTLAGLLGEKQQGGGIGGAAGAVAGAEIGSIITGIGTLVGGLIGGIGGSLLGGLFGAGKPTSASIFNAGAGNKTGLNADGTLANVTYGAKGNNTAYATQAQAALSSTLSGASSALGFKFSPQVFITGGSNTLHSPGGEGKPGYLTVAGEAKDKNGVLQQSTATQNFAYDPSDATSVSGAYFGALTAAAQLSGYNNTQALHDWFYGAQTIAPQTAGSPSSGGSGINIAPKVT